MEISESAAPGSQFSLPFRARGGGGSAEGMGGTQDRAGCPGQASLLRKTRLTKNKIKKPFCFLAPWNVLKTHPETAAPPPFPLSLCSSSSTQNKNRTDLSLWQLCPRACWSHPTKTPGGLQGKQEPQLSFRALLGSITFAGDSGDTGRGLPTEHSF